MAQRGCRPELINCKRQKTQKIQQIQNAKCKLLTVEWHKEAADQRPAHGPASCLAEAPSLVLQLFERGSQNCFHKFCNLVDWGTLSSIKSSRKFSQSFYEASSLTEASNLVKWYPSPLPKLCWFHDRKNCRLKGHTKNRFLIMPINNLCSIFTSWCVSFAIWWNWC